MVTALARAFEAREPGVAVRVATGLGSSARAAAVAAGTIDVAMASHGVDSADVARRGLAAHEIARVGVVFAVHAGVPVADVREQALCDVYAGTIASWRALGGPDVAIVPYARPAAEVDAEVAHAGIACLRGLVAGPAVRTVDRPEAMAAALAATPGAIGVTSLPFVVASGGRIRALSLGGVSPDAAHVRDGRWPLVRRSVLLTRAAPSPAVTRFLAFVRGVEGAAAIVANGAVPTAP